MQVGITGMHHRGFLGGDTTHKDLGERKEPRGGWLVHAGQCEPQILRFFSFLLAMLALLLCLGLF